MGWGLSSPTGYQLIGQRQYWHTGLGKEGVQSSRSTREARGKRVSLMSQGHSERVQTQERVGSRGSDHKKWMENKGRSRQRRQLLIEKTYKRICLGLYL